MSGAVRPPSKRPLRNKVCAWCDQWLESAAKGTCGRIYSEMPDGTPMGDCWWVQAIREHGPHEALAISNRRRKEKQS